jgi:type II secretory pathway pseudopilin PulG
MQELLDDIKALRRGIEALNTRSLEQGKPISRAEVNEVLAKVKEGTTISVDYKALAQNLQPHLATPDTIAAAVTTGTQQLAQVIDQIPRSMPLEDKVWGFTSIPVALTMISIVLAFFTFSVYSWKEKGAAEAQAALLQQQAERKANQDWLAKGYLDLKRDNPKAAQKYFPH